MKVRDLLLKVDREKVLSPLIILNGGTPTVRKKYLEYIESLRCAPDKVGLFNLVIGQAVNGILDYTFSDGWNEVENYIDTMEWGELANCYIETDLNINDGNICDRIAFFIISEATKFGDVFKNKEKKPSFRQESMATPDEILL